MDYAGNSHRYSSASLILKEQYEKSGLEDKLAFKEKLLKVDVNCGELVKQVRDMCMKL
jgi:hypothetical protein